MTKKILLAGGGYADIPMIMAAKKLGHYVITTGNKPDELGHLYSDEYHNVDFSDKEKLLILAQKLKIDGICPCCNDFSALSSAYVAEKMDLPGLDSYDVLETLMHKDRFRQFAIQWDIPVPVARGFLSVEEAMETMSLFRFPVLVKPVDLTGGKGISKIHDKNDLPKAVEYALMRSKTNRFVVEEYVTPDDCHHNFVAFLSHGKVAFYNSDNEHYFKNPFLVWGMSVPTKSPKTIDEELCKIAERVASILNLKPGILLMQHAAQDGKPIIIEISRRMPGNYHGKLIEYATGCNISEWAIKTCMGDDCSDMTHIEPRGNFAEHCIMSAKPGKVVEIRYSESIERNIIEKLIWGKEGHVIKNELEEKLGIVLMEFDSFDEMCTKMECMDQLIHVEIE